MAAVVSLTQFIRNVELTDLGVIVAYETTIETEILCGFFISFN
jgi:hypothetical protein